MRLKDRVTVVTGGSRGIGRSIALTFAEEGADVIVNYRSNARKAEEVVNQIEEMGKRAISIQADVANEEEAKGMIKRGLQEFQKIDILVNNAGIIARSKALESSREEWQYVLGANLLGSYYCIRELVPHFISRRYGKIVNLSSNLGIGVATSGEMPYAVSKSAVIVLTKKLAYELGPYGINVNAIAPGMIRTDMAEEGRSKEELESVLEDRVKKSALGRIGEPKDIANAALFLASDESSFVSGQVLVVDGGRFDYLSHGI